MNFYRYILFICVFVFLGNGFLLSQESGFISRGLIKSDGITQSGRYIVEFRQKPVSVVKNSMVQAKSSFASVQSAVQNASQKIKSQAGIIKNILSPNLGTVQIQSTSNDKRVIHEFQNTFSGVSVLADNDTLNKIKELDFVASVKPDKKTKICLVTSVPQIGVDSVWQMRDNNQNLIDGRGIRVAVIDTGVDYTHSHLGGGFGPGNPVSGGYDFVNNDSDPLDDHGHGTHVAGIIRANGSIVKGVAPGCQIYAYKVLASDGSGWNSDVIAAIDRAITDNCRVINLSLGSPGHPQDSISIAVNNAVLAGFIVVAAAGNSGSSAGTIESPGCAQKAITVGAVNSSDIISSFSSRGPCSDGSIKPDVVAPGGWINSTVLNQQFSSQGGTSMATPHVAGLCALILQAEPDLTPAQVKSRITVNARDLGYSANSQGSGLIQAEPCFLGESELYPSTHDFGDVDNSIAIWNRNLNLNLTNKTSEDATYQVSVILSEEYPGVNASIDKTSILVKKGMTAGLTLSLNVDNSLSDYGTYSGMVIAESNGVSIKTGFQARKKAPGFEISGNSIYKLIVFNTTGYQQSFTSPPNLLSLELAPGIYNVIAISESRNLIFVKENVVVADSVVPVEISFADCVNALKFSFEDEQTIPVSETSLCISNSYTGNGLFSFGTGIKDFFTNGFSSDYILEFCFHGVLANRVYEFRKIFNSGVNSSINVNFVSADLEFYNAKAFLPYKSFNDSYELVFSSGMVIENEENISAFFNENSQSKYVFLGSEEKIYEEFVVGVTPVSTSLLNSSKFILKHKNADNNLKILFQSPVLKFEPGIMKKFLYGNFLISVGEIRDFKPVFFSSPLLITASLREEQANEYSVICGANALGAGYSFSNGADLSSVLEYSVLKDGVLIDSGIAEQFRSFINYSQQGNLTLLLKTLPLGRILSTDNFEFISSSAMSQLSCSGSVPGIGNTPQIHNVFVAGNDKEGFLFSGSDSQEFSVYGEYADTGILKIISGNDFYEVSLNKNGNIWTIPDWNAFWEFQNNHLFKWMNAEITLTGSSVLKLTIPNLYVAVKNLNPESFLLVNGYSSTISSEGNYQADSYWGRTDTFYISSKVTGEWTSNIPDLSDVMPDYLLFKMRVSSLQNPTVKFIVPGQEPVSLNINTEQVNVKKGNLKIDYKYIGTYSNTPCGELTIVLPAFYFSSNEIVNFKAQVEGGGYFLVHKVLDLSDNNGPNISFDKPENIETYSSELLVKVSITDSDGVKEAYAVSSVKPDEKISINVSETESEISIPLIEGDQTIFINSFDFWGNSSSKSITVHRKTDVNGPVINVFNETHPFETYDSNYGIIFSVEDENPINVFEFRLNNNLVHGITLEAEEMSVSLDLIKGINTVSIKAVDIFDNQSILDFEIHYLEDNAPPVFSNMVPDNTTIVTENIFFNLQGKVDDINQITNSYFVFNNVQKVIEISDENQFEINIELTKGVNNLKIFAIDRFDNTGFIEYSIDFEPRQNSDLPVVNNFIIKGLGAKFENDKWVSYSSDIKASFELSDTNYIVSAKVLKNSEQVWIYNYYPALSCNSSDIPLTLSEGDNNFELRAFDEYGNELVYNFIVERKLPLPKVSLSGFAGIVNGKSISNYANVWQTGTNSYYALKNEKFVFKTEAIPEIPCEKASFHFRMTHTGTGRLFWNVNGVRVIETTAGNSDAVWTDSKADLSWKFEGVAGNGNCGHVVLTVDGDLINPLEQALIEVINPDNAWTMVWNFPDLVDNEAPKFLSVIPENNSEFLEMPVKISGRITDKSSVIVKLLKDGQEISSTETQNEFSFENITLIKGENVFVLNGEDSFGNISEEHLTLIYSPDEIAPQIEVFSPVNGENTFSYRKDLIIKVTDNGVINSVYALINGITAELQKTEDEWSFTGAPLIEGENTIKYYAIDSADNKTEQIVVINRELDITPPVLTLNSIENGKIIYTHFNKEISGQVTDNVLVDRIEASYNGTIISANIENGEFNFIVNAGFNGGELIVKAYDETGNEAVSSCILEFLAIDDGEDPVLNILSPQADYSLFYSDSFEIKGSSADNLGVSQLTITDGTNQLEVNGKESFSCNVNLVIGENNFVVTAKDYGGRVSSKELIIKREEAPAYIEMDGYANLVSVSNGSSNINYNSFWGYQQSFYILSSGTAIWETPVINKTALNYRLLFRGTHSGNSEIEWKVNNSFIVRSKAIKGSDIWTGQNGSVEFNYKGEYGGSCGEYTLTIPKSIINEGQPVRIEAKLLGSQYLLIQKKAGLVDITPPVITVSFPQNNSEFFNDPELTIKGTAKDDRKTARTWIETSGRSFTCEGEESWEADITLENGVNLIKISSADMANNLSEYSFSVTFIPDTENPNINITSPAQNYSTYNDQVMVNGAFIDNHALFSAEFIRNGEILYNLTLSGATHNFEYNFNDLVHGENTLQIKLTDKTGNSFSKDITVIRLEDLNPPVIEVLSPINTEVNLSKYTLSGIIEDETQNILCEVRVNEGEIVVLELINGNFNMPVSLIEGNNQIVITATDSSKNMATITGNISFVPPPDTESPVLTVNSPFNNGQETVYEQTVQISGTASDNIEVSKVEYSFNGSEFTGVNGLLNWSFEIRDLVEGQNSIVIKAYDGAGNVAQKNIIVEYKDQLEKIVINGYTQKVQGTDINYQSFWGITPSFYALKGNFIEFYSDTITAPAKDIVLVMRGTHSGGGIVKVFVNENKVVEFNAVQGNFIQTEDSCSIRYEYKGSFGGYCGEYYLTIPGTMAELNNKIRIRMEMTGSQYILIQKNSELVDIENPLVNLSQDNPLETWDNSVIIRGSITDNGKIGSAGYINKTTGEQGNIEQGESFFTPSIGLVNGENIIEIFAIDLFENKGVAVHKINRKTDTNAPQISLTNPSEDVEVSEPVITVSGTVTDEQNGIKVEILNTANNFIKTMTVNSGNFSAPVSLIVGENLIKIKAEDVSQNSFEIIRTITFIPPPDTTPPVLVITSPENGKTFYSQIIQISGTVEDTSGIKTLDLFVNNVKTSTLTNTGGFVFENVNLIKGENSFRIIAEDNSNNTVQKEFSVIYSDLPEKLVINGYNNKISGTDINYQSFWGTKPSFYALKGSSIVFETPVIPYKASKVLFVLRGTQSGGGNIIWKVNDREIATSIAEGRSGKFSSETGSVEYSYKGSYGGYCGEYIITIDGSLIEADKKVKIEAVMQGSSYILIQKELSAVDTIPPKITSLLEITETYKASVDIPLSIEENGTVVAVKWRKNTDPWNTSDSIQSTGPVSLNAGDNTIIISAEDNSGNIGQLSLTIKRLMPQDDNTIPQLTMVYPLIDQTLSVYSEEIVFKGNATDNSAVTRVSLINQNTGNTNYTESEGDFALSIPLNIGKNTIVLTVTDANNNTVEKTWTITREEAPEILEVSGYKEFVSTTNGKSYYNYPSFWGTMPSFYALKGGIVKWKTGVVDQGAQSVTFVFRGSHYQNGNADISINGIKVLTAYLENRSTESVNGDVKLNFEYKGIAGGGISGIYSLTVPGTMLQTGSMQTIEVSLPSSGGCSWILFQHYEEQ